MWIAGRVAKLGIELTGQQFRFNTAISSLYIVMERPHVGDHIYWKSIAEDRESNSSMVNAIIETADRTEVRVVGPVVVSMLLSFRRIHTRILTGILQTRAKMHTAAQTTNNVEDVIC